MFCPGTWIMVRQETAQEKTAGGIIIPDKSKAGVAPFRGVVECAGIACQFVRTGDMVRFDRTGGKSKVAVFTDTIDDETSPTGKITLAFMDEEAVMAVENRDYSIAAVPI